MKTQRAQRSCTAFYINVDERVCIACNPNLRIEALFVAEDEDENI